MCLHLKKDFVKHIASKSFTVFVVREIRAAKDYESDEIIMSPYFSARWTLGEKKVLSGALVSYMFFNRNGMVERGFHSFKTIKGAVKMKRSLEDHAQSLMAHKTYAVFRAEVPIGARFYKGYEEIPNYQTGTVDEHVGFTSDELVLLEKA